MQEVIKFWERSGSYSGFKNPKCMKVPFSDLSRGVHYDCFLVTAGLGGELRWCLVKRQTLKNC